MANANTANVSIYFKFYKQGCFLFAAGAILQHIDICLTKMPGIEPLNISVNVYGL